MLLKKKDSQTVCSHKFPLVVAESCYERENLDLNVDNDNDDLESPESLESGFVLLSENEQNFAYSDEKKKTMKLLKKFGK